MRAQRQFQTDLKTLVGGGNAGLAAQLSDMGYEAGGSIASQATKMSKGARKKLTKRLNKQDKLSDPLMGDALALARELQASPEALGIIGLANASGMSVGDVVGLLQRFGGVFSGLPKGSTRQIRADQRLIGKGQQPSGLEGGGIVTGAQTSGLYYRWAEPGSGGESLIPHGADKRQRATELWEATGRIIGARTSSGGGTMVLVSDGAVKVAVDLSGANGLTAADVERATRKATSAAMTDLVRELKTGGN